MKIIFLEVIVINFKEEAIKAVKGREIGRDRVEFLGKAKNFEKIMIERETAHFFNELRK